MDEAIVRGAAPADAELERRLRGMGRLNIYACIAYPKQNDEYLTDNSARFHEHLGFVTVGHFHSCACKFGRWYDMVWMEKAADAYPDAPAAVKPYNYRASIQFIISNLSL